MNTPEKLPGLIFTYPGQNSAPDGEIKPWSKDGSHIFDQTMSKVRNTLGADFQSKWAKPVVLLGLTVALSLALRGYLRKRADTNIALSMGEMSSLVGGGAIEFDPMVEIMRERSILTSIPTNPETGLAVIVGPTSAEVRERLEQAKKDGLEVGIANINTPTQTVIGGLVQHFSEISKRFPEARRFLHIEEIGRAFHTLHMNDIVDPYLNKARSILSTTTLRDPHERIYSPMQQAATGSGLVSSAEQARQIILGQLETPVDQPPVWDQIVRDGVKIVICFDPKGLMPSMVRGNIGRDIRIINVSTPLEMKRALEALKEAYPDQLDDMQQQNDELDEIIASQTAA